jgi:hypothetical protein
VVAAPISHVGGRLVARVVVQARPDFPARALTGLMLQISASGAAAPVAERPLPELVPGQRIEVVLESAPDAATGSTTVQIIRPDGSVMHRIALLDSITSAGAASR